MVGEGVLWLLGIPHVTEPLSLWETEMIFPGVARSCVSINELLFDYTGKVATNSARVCEQDT